MIYLQGLAEHGDYVDLGDSWVVSLNSGLYSIDGKEFRSHGSRQNNQLLVSPNTEIHSVIKGEKEKVFYLDSDDNRLSVEEYDNILNENKEKYRDEDFYVVYPDLDTEYKCKKALDEIKDYAPQYKQHPDTYEKVELKCVGKAQDTGSKYIETALAYGKAGFHNSNFFKVDAYGVTCNELYKFVNNHDLRGSLEVPDHSGIRFSKIKGDYVCTNLKYNEPKQGSSVFCQTLEDAKAKEKSIRESVRQHLNMKVLGNLEIDSITYKKVYNDLSSIQNSLRGLEVKKKSEPSKSSLIQKVNKSINDLKEYFDKVNQN